MHHWLRLSSALLLALLSGCSDYAPRNIEIAWRYQPSTYFWTLRVESSGLATDEGAAPKDELLSSLTAGRRYLNLGGWLVTWDFDALEQQAREDLRSTLPVRLADLPVLLRRLKDFNVLRRIRLENAVLTPGSAGLPTLTQTFSFQGFSQLLHYLNSAQRRALTPRSASQRVKLLADLSAVLGPRPAERLLASAAAGDTWYSLEGPAVLARLPLNALELARCLQLLTASQSPDHTHDDPAPWLAQLLSHLKIEDDWLTLIL